MGHSDDNLVGQRDAIDDLIDRCKMVERTGKTREEIHKTISKAVICLNLAHVLADVCESLVMDSEDILHRFGATFERADKLNFRRMANYMHEAKKAAYRACKGPYSTTDADDYANEADWWYNMVRLLEDRTGEDALKTKQVLEWISTMPSVLNMFDVKKRDFQRIIC